MFGLKSGTGGLRPSSVGPEADLSLWNFISSLQYNEYVRVGNYPIGTVFHLRLEVAGQVLSQDVAVTNVRDIRDFAWQDRTVRLLYEVLSDLRRRADSCLVEKTTQQL